MCRFGEFLSMKNTERAEIKQNDLLKIKIAFF